MRKPYFRQQSGTWVIKVNGKLRTLGKDPHGATRKNPPPEIAEAWHALTTKTTPKNMTIGDAAARYIAYLTHPQTIKVTREHLDRFMKFVGKGTRISELRVHHVNDFLKTTSWADSTKATAISKITSALNHAVAEGHIEEHKVKYPRGKKPRMARREIIPTQEQQAQIEAEAPVPLRRILAALRLSGCRPNELCAVTIDKVNLKGRVMTVPNKTKKSTGKKEREVYLSNDLADLIREAIGSRKEGRVFLNCRGTPWNPPHIGHRVREIRVKIGWPVGVSVYGYRHKYVSDAVNHTDANLALLGKQVGHSNLGMIMNVYLKEDSTAMKATVNKIAEGAKREPPQ